MVDLGVRVNGRPVYLSPFHAQPVPAPTERGKPSLDSDFSTPVVDHRGSEFVIVYCKHVTLEDVIPPCSNSISKILLFYNVPRHILVIVFLYRYP